MGLLFVLPWVIPQSLTNATRALSTRGDLDFLLASPFSARAMLLARALAIVVEALSSAAIFLLPLVNMNILAGRTHWLTVYPTLLGCGLFGTAAGLVLAMGLFAVVGPRKTRLVSQVVSTVIGAAFAIGVQAINIFPDRARAALLARLDTAPSGNWLNHDGPFWLPVRAAAGDWHAVWIWLMITSFVFILVGIFLGKFFAGSAIAAIGTQSVPPVSRRALQPRRFAGGPRRSLRRKEWRLLARDPWLVSQMMMQILYVLPIGVVCGAVRDRTVPSLCGAAGGGRYLAAIGFSGVADLIGRRRSGAACGRSGHAATSGAGQIGGDCHPWPCSRAFY
jgi:ABC-2 type transport system permease protein